MKINRTGFVVKRGDSHLDAELTPVHRVDMVFENFALHVLVLELLLSLLLALTLLHVVLLTNPLLQYTPLVIQNVAHPKDGKPAQSENC